MHKRFFTEDEIVGIINILSSQTKECTRSEKNGALNDFKDLLINAQDIESAETRKEIVNMIWATLMVHLKNIEK